MDAKATEPSTQRRMQRIVVVGTSGSGKTTLTRQLSALLHIPAVELDALHWEPNWTEAPLAVLRERVDGALSGEAWAVDGNYSKVRDFTWGRADTVVWLDYSLWVVMTRVIWRTFSRLISREELWNGNRERLGNTLFSKESILLWALQTHQKNRRTYTELTSQPEYTHLQIVRHRSPQATRLWLAGVHEHSKVYMMETLQN
jgi:adenylate kinase family enzyme